MRVLVTGAAGMLGRAVMERFSGRHEVVPMTRADCDLTELRDTVRFILERKPDLIVHCAAWTDVDGCELEPSRALLQNGWATRNVALAACELGASLCYVSTDYVFDGEKSGPYLEEDSTRPINVYGVSKWRGEQHVMQHVPRFWIVRTSWLFGPGGRNFVRTMSGLLRERDEVRVVDDQVGSPTYTPDLAAGLLELVESGRHGIYHLTNRGACSWYELAVAIGQRLATPCRIVPCSSAEFPRPARRPHNSVLANGAYGELGLPPLRDWRAAVDDYLEILEREAA